MSIADNVRKIAKSRKVLKYINQINTILMHLDCKKDKEYIRNRIAKGRAGEIKYVYLCEDCQSKIKEPLLKIRGMLGSKK